RVVVGCVRGLGFGWGLGGSCRGRRGESRAGSSSARGRVAASHTRLIGGSGTSVAWCPLGGSLASSPVGSSAASRLAAARGPPVDERAGRLLAFSFALVAFASPAASGGSFPHASAWSRLLLASPNGFVGGEAAGVRGSRPARGPGRRSPGFDRGAGAAGSARVVAAAGGRGRGRGAPDSSALARTGAGGRGRAPGGACLEAAEDARGCCGVRVQRAEVEAARLRLRAGRCRSRPRPVPLAARRGAAAARAQAGRGGGVLRASVGALARAAVLRAAVGAARQGGGRAARAASPGGA